MTREFFVGDRVWWVAQRITSVTNEYGHRANYEDERVPDIVTVVDRYGRPTLVTTSDGGTIDPSVDMARLTTRI